MLMLLLPLSILLLLTGFGVMFVGYEFGSCKFGISSDATSWLLICYYWYVGRFWLPICGGA